MKTKRFAPRDAKIMREHPDSSPEELLELGLSKRAYERITESQLPEKQNNVLQPVKVEHMPPVQSKSIVRMVNMRTGRVVNMGYKAAGMLSDKYPKEFKILK